MLMTGYFKIAESGGTYVVATFYNPVTKDVITKCVRDYDYEDGSRDDDELYYMPIDETVAKIYAHDNGRILVGDTARVIKGRTLEHGHTDVVKDIRPYEDRYGRTQATYLYFEHGGKINIDNCELV